ncbi:RidA family protein [Sphingomonas sp. AP4-R1]|uniref:RidA family protein n=1 Tax=Sphingomonas sp. AP4-R1 TaxID=2735134 RepID=UPI001493B680|nr:RidA family protein [Sphingomonas sp. AP4-R1]QJU58176.1 RidA family protein [Sphingomonas sp. AP4-R1]
MKEALSVPNLGDSTPYGYVQGILANDFVFVAGQVGVDENYRPVGTDVQSQANKTFDNIIEVLAVAGLDLSDIVTMTVFLTDLRSDFSGFIEVRKTYFDGIDLPTSAVIGISALALPELKVEIQAIAARRKP